MKKSSIDYRVGTTAKKASEPVTVKEVKRAIEDSQRVPWIDYVPVMTASGGTLVTVAPTVGFARYLLQGKVIFLTYYLLSFTLDSVTSLLYLSLPPGISGPVGNAIGSIMLENASSNHCRFVVPVLVSGETRLTLQTSSVNGTGSGTGIDLGSNWQSGTHAALFGSTMLPIA